MNEECKGCKDARYSKLCFIRANGNKQHVEMCPCKVCLIKPMCREGCYEYAQVSDLVEDTIHG